MPKKDKVVSYNHPINVLDASIVVVDIDDHFITLLDVFDPWNYDILDVKTKNILIEKRPLGALNITFHIDRLSRRFSYSSFFRKLSNWETFERKMLVYYKDPDKVEYIVFVVNWSILKIAVTQVF